LRGYDNIPLSAQVASSELGETSHEICACPGCGEHYSSHYTTGLHDWWRPSWGL